MNPASIERSFSGARVLVTGGLGFIGSNLARRLADLGAEVAVMDPLPGRFGGDPFNLNGYEGRMGVHPVGLGDGRAAEIVRGREYVFNLAGQVSHTLSMEDPRADLEVNVRSQLSFLETCRRHAPEAKIIYAGTRQVYGPPRYLPVDESHPVSPADVNAVHKLAGEQYHLLYNRAYGLRTTVFRMSNIYGPRMRVKDGLKTFLGLWIRQLLGGEEITVYGDGSAARDLLYVDDAGDALLLAALHSGSDGQTYNLGGGEPVRLLDLAKIIIEVNGGGRYRLVPFPSERRKIDIGSYASDLTKIRSELGWQPITPLRAGLEKTLEFYRRHREQYW